MLPQPRTLLPGIPAPSPHSPVLPLLHYAQPRPAPCPQDREHTTMMNRAGATKAQMAPFPSDSQQLQRETDGYFSASPHPLQHRGPASRTGQGQCGHGDNNALIPTDVPVSCSQFQEHSTLGKNVLGLQTSSGKRRLLQVTKLVKNFTISEESSQNPTKDLILL